MAVEGNSNSQQVNSFPLLHHHRHCDQQLRKRKSRCCVFLKPRMEDLKQQADILMTIANENEFDVQFLSLPRRPRPPESELGQNLHSNEIERLSSCLVVIAWLWFWGLIVQLGLPWSQISAHNILFGLWIRRCSLQLSRSTTLSFKQIITVGRRISYLSTEQKTRKLIPHDNKKIRQKCACTQLIHDTADTFFPIK